MAHEKINWRLVVICWAIVTALLYLPALPHPGTVLPFTDNDDVMRMVTATDLADGQNWQDKLEHRDNAPYGSPMHWSRLVDAPIAGILLVLRPALGAMAPDVTALVWPPVLLFGLLVVSVLLTRRLMGPGHQLAAVILPVLSIVVLAEFAPGRIDHHNVQMILTTALVWATVVGRTSRWAAVAAGLLAATSLAIGVETLPFLVGAVVAFSLFWVHDTAAAGSARAFAVALAGATLAHFLIATAPGLYFVAACDELSDFYVVAAALAGGAIVAATLLGNRLPASRRLILIALLGALAGAATLGLFPQCRGGPYAQLDPRAFDLLLAHVPEAQPLWVRFAHDPVTALSFAAASFAGLAVLVWIVRSTRGDKRIDWLVVALYLALASIVMVFQIRGARLAVMPAMPVGAWLIDRARQTYADRASVVRGAGLLASWLLFAGILQFALPAFVSELSPGPAEATVPKQGASSDAYPACYEAAAYRALAAQPPGIVLAPMTIGVRVLRNTPDSVVSAGYHRNIAGALDEDDFYNAGEAAARAIAMRRGIDYVVTCEGMGQLMPTTASAADSFDALYAQHRHWSWLTPISDPADRLQIFRVDLIP